MTDKISNPGTIQPQTKPGTGYGPYKYSLQIAFLANLRNNKRIFSSISTANHGKIISSHENSTTTGNLCDNSQIRNPCVQAVSTTTHDQKHTTSLSKPSGDHQPLTELLHEQPPPLFSSAPLAFSPPRIPKVQADEKFCRKPSKRGMVAKVLKRLKPPKLVKSILSRSLKFGGCIAGKYCGCLRLRFSQAVALCFCIICARCMKQAISDSVHGCTLCSVHKYQS
ncbi:hypothetical protein L484_025806 [Morus notabilis]|uniref:Uncharacterized protein n=1 Tax=Morus notabilis TaxID=981085 RepID=W9RSI1_9ROSA|nr:hypothetical protein L484_025806 [Morus notabilis]